MNRRSLSLLVAALVAVVLAGGAVATTGVVSIDGDDRSALYEHRHGSDPLSADTDGDGLDDGAEYDRGTDPASPDTDGDGLTDRGELDYPPNTDGEETVRLDPLAADSDRDGLDDGTEVDGPTDPLDPDSDGDRLADGWEVADETDDGTPLPGSDPLHKDVYVEVIHLRNATLVPQDELANATAAFANAPVENPDGTTGIALHVTGATRRVEMTKRDVLDAEDLAEYETVEPYKRQFMNAKSMETEPYAYTLVVVVGERGAGGALGVGANAIAILSDPATYPGPYEGLFVHELLHTMTTGVTADDSSCDVYNTNHACEGYLSHGDDLFFSDATVEWLNENDMFGGCYGCD